MKHKGVNSRTIFALVLVLLLALTTSVDAQEPAPLCYAGYTLSAVNASSILPFTPSTEVAIDNVNPTVGSISAPMDPVPLGTQLSAEATFTDPGFLDTHTALWDWGDNSTSAGTVSSGAVGPDNHTYNEPGIYTIELTVTDDDGGSDTSIFEFVVVYDPSAGFVTGGGWIDSQAGAYYPAELPFFDGSYYEKVAGTVTWYQANEAANARSLEGCASAHLATITSEEEKDAINAALGSGVAFSWLGGHREQDQPWQWVTGEPWEYTFWETPPPDENERSVSIGGAGVPDPDVGWIYNGRWLAWIPSETREGYIVEYEDCLTGKATFGFVSKYQKGASVPTGNTAFQFQVGGLKFHSTAYEWLVVNQGGTNAQFKGSGLINDAADPNGQAYKFMLWAGDGATTGGSDTFRIRIWSEDADAVEHDVYDNGTEQAIGGGSIVVHTKK